MTLAYSSELMGVATILLILAVVGGLFLLGAVLTVFDKWWSGGPPAPPDPPQRLDPHWPDRPRNTTGMDL